MNVILLGPQDCWLDDTTVLLRDRRAVHILEVLKPNLGDTLRVGIRDGALGTGRVVAMEGSTVKLVVQTREPPPRRHRFEIVLALPRPKMLRRILRTVAEFGVSDLHLINTARVEKSFWQSPLLAGDKVEEALLAGMERSRDTVAPRVHQHRLFRPFVEDRLVDICSGRPCWIAEMGSAQALSTTAAGSAVVMIGPEGGFVPFELDLAQAVIARPVHLGERLLSVDTALAAVLALGWG